MVFVTANWSRVTYTGPETAVQEFEKSPRGQMLEFVRGKDSAPLE